MSVRRCVVATSSGLTPQPDSNILWPEKRPSTRRWNHDATPACQPAALIVQQRMTTDWESIGNLENSDIISPRFRARYCCKARFCVRVSTRTVSPWGARNAAVIRVSVTRYVHQPSLNMGRNLSAGCCEETRSTYRLVERFNVIPRSARHVADDSVCHLMSLVIEGSSGGNGGGGSKTLKSCCRLSQQG
jgi:hypothetical protein